MSFSNKIGFKLLRRYNRQLWSYGKSSCSDSYFNQYCYIRYLIGISVYPKKFCGPLSVFNTYSDLVYFLDSECLLFDNKDTVIYLCSYASCIRDSLFASYKHYSYIDRFFESLSFRHFPIGTRLASSVTLLGPYSKSLELLKCTG